MPSRTIARWVAPALLPLLVGCVGSRGESELLEARLRDQQDLVAKYEKLLDSNQQELTLARKESDLLRTQIASAHANPLLPEHADVLLRAEKLAFHQMMTGTRDLDGRPGDDALNVVLMPQSQDGETVRLIGDLELEALDLSRPEGQQRIGDWKFTPQQARELWHSGFLASGFQVDVPWESRTAGPDIVLHARLTTPDGRQFDASHQLRVETPVIQTAAASAALPQVEPRRMPPNDPAQPIDATESSPPQVAALEPLDRPRVQPDASPVIDAEPATADAPPPNPFDVDTPAVAESSSEKPADDGPAPFPGGAASAADATVPDVAHAEPSVVEPFPTEDEPLPVSESAEQQMVARPVPETPFDILPNELPPPEVAARSPIESLDDDPAGLPAIHPGGPAAVQEEPAPQTAQFPTEGLPATLLPIEPEAATPIPSSTIPASPAPSSPSANATAPGITIQPLAPPQRFRRTAERPVPPPMSAPAVVIPGQPESPQPPIQPATPFDAAAPQEPPAGSPPDPAPYPVDVTVPPATGVIQSSVNWTDESIPYLR